jgi:hypothetical protein
MQQQVNVCITAVENGYIVNLIEQKCTTVFSDGQEALNKVAEILELEPAKPCQCPEEKTATATSRYIVDAENREEFIDVLAKLGDEVKKGQKNNTITKMLTKYEDEQIEEALLQVRGLAPDITAASEPEEPAAPETAEASSEAPTADKKTCPVCDGTKEVTPGVACFFCEKHEAGKKLDLSGYRAQGKALLDLANGDLVMLKELRSSINEIVLAHGEDLKSIPEEELEQVARESREKLLSLALAAPAADEEEDIFA